MIHLKIELADGTDVDTDALAEKLLKTDSLALVLQRQVVIHPVTLDWIEGTQTYEQAQADNEEISDGNGGYIAGADHPYDETGILIRDLSPEDRAKYTEDDYYYQVRTAEWSGKSEWEKYVADWMTENPGSHKDLITHGCVSGMVGDLVYHSQIIETIQEYKADLEVEIQYIADNLGDMGFLFGQCKYNPSDFSFDRLVWMCFEQSVRKALLPLNLEDV